MEVIERKALNNPKIHKLPWWKKHERDTKRKEWKNNSSFFLPRVFLFSNTPLLTLTIHMGFTRKQHNKHLAESNDFTVVMGTCSNQKLGGSICPKITLTWHFLWYNVPLSGFPHFTVRAVSVLHGTDSKRCWKHFRIWWANCVLYIHDVSLLFQHIPKVLLWIEGWRGAHLSTLTSLSWAFSIRSHYSRSTVSFPHRQKTFSPLSSPPISASARKIDQLD